MQYLAMSDFPIVPMAELPEGGAIPDRRSPAAVIFLRRLATSNPRHENRDLAPLLYELADELNALIPERGRIAKDDPRSVEAFSGFSDRALVETAVCAIGMYRTSPEKLARTNSRRWAFISLERYFVWCHAMFLAAATAHANWGDRIHDPALSSALDDGGEHALAFFMHCYASLSVVIEGWEKLDLRDAEIDALLAAGGNLEQPGTFRYRLKRLRNGVFHYQEELSSDPKFREFMSDAGAGTWATKLHRAFERYFRESRKLMTGGLDDWLFAPPE